ncbi:MAG: hypothetical protein LBE56_04200, partial [Tannerella sp.]|nr:hypothetical protein [Tannerella sp.]
MYLNINDLDSFSFAIIGCSIVDIKDYLEKQDYDYLIKYEEIDIGCYYFQNMFLMPIKGTAKGLFYNPVIATNLTVLLGNGRSAWGTLCNNISSNLSVCNLQIEFNTKNSDVIRNQMTVFDGSKKIRVIQNYLGDNNKMEFVNGGKPLWFEDIEYYKKRKIWDRINKDILIEYAK